MQTEVSNLNIEAIRKAVSEFSDDHYLLSEIHYFEEVKSTNDWLMMNGSPNEVCISEMQIAGKGRRGNKWISPRIGNIYFSICYETEGVIPYQSLMGLVISIAIAEALEKFGCSGHGIKWPNDIYWQNKKLGGILIETNTQSNNFIIGVGLNFNLSGEISDHIDQESTSITQSMNDTNVSREKLMVLLFSSIAKYLKGFSTLNLQDFRKQWLQWDILDQKRVSFNQDGQHVSGVVEGIDEAGRLGIRTRNNGLEYFSSADIHLDKRNEK